MNFCVYLHMHSHGNIFVISASLLYYNVISWYIWLFLWCSIREKNGVKRSVSLSPIYHPLAMTGYINMSFISDPREGIWSVSICIMNKVKEIIKEQTKPICWQTCCLDRLLLILWWKPPAPPPIPSPVGMLLELREPLTLFISKLRGDSLGSFQC